MALFACSFDAASPLAPWTTATNVSIVAGRDANGCSIPGASSFLNVTGAFGASCTAGLAWLPSSFINAICILADNGGGVGAPHASIVNNGDGRMVITIGANGLGSTTTASFDGFVQNIGIWNYYELSVDIVKTVTPVDATHSDLTIQVTASAYVNDNFIGTVTDGWSASFVLNSDLPAGTISSLAIQQNFCVVDDVYVNATRIGDCFVAPDDTTVTVETSAPDITQSLFEVGLIDPTAAPDITQTVIEVGLAPGSAPLSLACPVGGGTATIGVLYDEFLTVSGGTPPYTWEIIP